MVCVVVVFFKEGESVSNEMTLAANEMTLAVLCCAMMCSSVLCSAPPCPDLLHPAPPCSALQSCEISRCSRSRGLTLTKQHSKLPPPSSTLPSSSSSSSKALGRLVTKEDTIDLLKKLTMPSKDGANGKNATGDRPDLFPIIPSSLRKRPRPAGGSEFFSGNEGTFLDHGSPDRRERRIADLKHGLLLAGKEYNLLKGAHQKLKQEVVQLEEEVRVASLGDRVQESNDKQLTRIKSELAELREKGGMEAATNKVSSHSRARGGAQWRA